jgi:choline dehydrogenase-like flavoprotein
LKSGATKIYLPQPGKVVEKEENVTYVLEELEASKIEISSVHAMSSLPIRKVPKRNELNSQAKFHGYENLFIVDASMLPTTIGESPQGTIMALAKTIFNNWEI